MKTFSYISKLPIVIITLLLFFSNQSNAQTELDDRAVINFDEGIGFLNPDSLYGVNLRFRMQNRVGMNTVSGQDMNPANFEAQVRRLRLRFDGFMGENNFTYYLQLSFTRGDQDWDNSGFPGIVRDAMVFYTFNDHFYIGFGQGKLPGNRQRVVSSGSLQFSDRSAVNAIFNIDRDFGLMAYYSNRLAGIDYNIKTAVSSGEGRNIAHTDNGLSYTGRLELLPLGKFLSSGDFFEGDLMREPTPKFSLAAGGSFNHKATRVAGQRGQSIPGSQDILSFFADIMAKYNGWALSLEYASRVVEQQQIFVVDDNNLYSYTGWGFNGQLSYIFPSNYEIAGRYTYIRPDNTIKWFENRQEIFTLGLSKYFQEHRNKLQFNVSYNQNPGPAFAAGSRDFWNFMIQIETGI